MCKIANIRSVWGYPEAYAVDTDGSRIELILAGAPKTFHPQFWEFYCIKHDCSFHQWKAVARHLKEIQ